MRHPEIFVQREGMQLCSDAFGDPSHTPILLIMGAMASMMWWEDAFCEQLALRGMFVLRFDHRDTGKSTCFDGPPPPYSVLDMADDALHVLDAYHVHSAHVAGMSLGGMIAQLLAMREPDRIRSITMIASSVWDDRPDLPPIDARVLDYHASAAALDWTSRDEVLRYLVEGRRVLLGSGRAFDETAAAELAAMEWNRAVALPSMSNHALLTGGEEYYGQCSRLTLPALIIHGSDDAVLPWPHALALSETLPHATLLRLEGAGHELHHNDWPLIVDAIAAQCLTQQITHN